MCGIAGVAGPKQGYRADIETARTMCAQIVYRGPDEEGLWAEQNVALGMRRLSIIDLSGGSQPIYNETGTILTVFNGEIYNFVSLRAELEGYGHKFSTNADTETLVHGYEQFGNQFVKKLRGMFGLAIYDRNTDTILLARDRLGKKPLHYALHNGVLYFASEIKSILAVAPQLAEVDDISLAQFLYYGYVPDPRTIFKNIKKLPPGHLLQFSRGQLKLEQYWDLPQFGTFNASTEECLERMEAILTDAVRMRLISDVPLGALLSGGVDSSTVVGMMARVSNTPVKTFSIGFGESAFDESAAAKEVADTFGTEHQQLRVEPDLWETAQYLSEILDEPFADSSAIPTYHVSRLARQHVTVALSGDGGDEFFIGYDRYIAQQQRRYFDLVPRWAGALYQEHVFPKLPAAIRGRKLAFNIGSNSRDRFIDGESYISGRNTGAPLLTRQFKELFDSTHPESVLQRYFDAAPASDFLSRMQYTDIKAYMTADVLAKVDRMSMAASLEVRSPLLDHVFVEFVASIPVSMKLKNGTRKYLLRKLAEKIGVPAHILQRKKQGFALPLVHWTRNELKEQVRGILLEPRSVQRGLFTADGIETLLREHDGGRDYSHVIWQMVALELWFRNYLENRAWSKPVHRHGSPNAIAAR